MLLLLLRLCHLQLIPRPHRGTAAVVAKLDASGSPAVLLKQVGMTLVSTVGGASGPLYGTFFLRMGTSAGDRAEFDGAAFAAALRAGLEGVLTRGKAQLGDKTMVDALTPAVDALDAALADGADRGAHMARLHDVREAADFLAVRGALRGQIEVQRDLHLPEQLRRVVPSDGPGR